MLSPLVIHVANTQPGQTIVKTSIPYWDLPRALALLWIGVLLAWNAVLIIRYLQTG